MLPSESSRYTVWRGSFRQCPIDFRMLPWRVGSSYSLRTKHFSDSHWFRRLTRASRPATQPTPYGRGAPACPSESGRLGLKLGDMRKQLGFGDCLVGFHRLCGGHGRARQRAQTNAAGNGARRVLRPLSGPKSPGRPSLLDSLWQHAETSESPERPVRRA